MSYNVQFQTEEKYKNVKYGGNSVYNSACGCASLCNALEAAGIAHVPLLDMCKFSVSEGARVDGGTLEGVLLKAAAKKYGFAWKSTSKNAELLKHLQDGGVAILHAGDTYKLFSNSGHFVAAVAASGETITVLDSYWYSTKYTSSSIRRNFVSTVAKGVIKTSLSQCGKATIDRSPSYYLIYKAATIPDDAENKLETKEEDEDMITYYEKIGDVPEYYREAVELLVAQDALTGVDGNLHLSEDTCRVLTMLKRAGAIQPVYQKIEDIPKWYQDAVEKLIDCGALKGTSDNTLGVSEDLCRIATILDRAGVFQK